jgi:pyruvate formate lyase activating enzyme
MVFNIQRFSTHDGSGIRTLVFYKGCPLRCAWCSNPESQSFGYDLLYDRRICMSFGDCIQAMPDAVSRQNGCLEIHRERLRDPLRLDGVCLSRALTLAGEEKSPEELVREVEKDLPFYRSGEGGVTLSGGEPLAQGHELVAFLKLLKDRHIDVSVETSLHVRWDQVERTRGLVDTYLADLKHTDPRKFRQYTQGDLNLVLSNLRRLVKNKEKVIIRIPVIPEFNHTSEEIRAIIDFAEALHDIHELHFLLYHTLGVEKYAMLGLKYPFGVQPIPEEKDLLGYMHYAREKGFTVEIGG